MWGLRDCDHLRVRRDDIRPTAEQEAILEAARQGVGLSINAFAGTGKTTTLAMVARALANKKVLYLAFNRAIAEEAKKRMPPNTEARTFHSLAFRATRPDPSRLECRLHGKYIADVLNLPGMTINKANYDPDYIGRAVLMTVVRYCMSPERDMSVYHVPPPASVLPQSHVLPDILVSMFNQPGEDLDSYKSFVLEKTRTLWDMMSAPGSTFPITHDVYVKQWALGNPVIEADVILFDEAQDASGLFIDIVERQHGAQKIWVGDAHQQIYEWREAINALDRVRVDSRLYLTESWRFGPDIADTANHVLRVLGETRPLLGRGGTSRGIGEAILCRTNLGALDIYVYYVERGAVVRLENALDLIPLVDACEALQQGQRKGPFALFPDWKALVEHADTSQGGELKPLVDAVIRYGCAALRNMLRLGIRERAELTVSTVHRAKGLEWDKVTVSGDWGAIKNAKLMSEEKRLLYVALTRARCHLEMSGFVQEWIAEMKADADLEDEKENIALTDSTPSIAD